MFAGTPRIRDLLDARTVVAIAIVSLLAFGFQLAALAGLFASPLGDAVARLDGVERPGATEEALAAADATAAPRASGRATRARVRSARPAATLRATSRPDPATQACVLATP